MIKKIILPLTILDLTALTLFLNTTNPSEAGPIGILLLFIMIYAASLGVSICAFSVYYSLNIYISRFISRFKPKNKFSLISAYYYSTVYALIPVFVIGFKSVGVFGLYELLLIVVFEILGLFYVRKKVLS